MGYAATTSVSIERSRNQLEVLLRKHGATGIASVWDEEANRQYLEFKIRVVDVQRVCRLEVPLPDREEYRYTDSGRTRTEAQLDSVFDQAMRSRWRVMVLMVKAKLEAIDCGASVFEQEFLSAFVLDTGQTVGEVLIPNLPLALTGGTPLALPGATS